MRNHIKSITTIACIFFAPGVMHSTPHAKEIKPFKFLRITIPKSGTHLLEKCINMMYAKNPSRANLNGPAPTEESLPQKCAKISREKFLSIQQQQRVPRIKKNRYQPKGSVHLAYTPKRENFAKKCASPKLFLIRDPRDQLVSFTKWTCPKSKHGTVDFNNMLLDLIDGKQRTAVYSVRQHEHCAAMWSLGIAEYYKLYLPWMAVDNVYTVRFEDLVGQNGGGSRAAQVEEILNIAHHLKIELTPHKLKYIADNLFGGTSTFNKGQIGSWKEYFTKAHKKAFKKAAGQLLIDLGYEKDMNW